MDDLWDFGTVRHVSRQATIGRRENTYTSNAATLVNSVDTSPVTPNARVAAANNTTNNRTPQGPRIQMQPNHHTGSEISLHVSLSSKADKLPPLPSKPSSPTSPKRTSFDGQATVRNGPSDTASYQSRAAASSPASSRTSVSSASMTRSHGSDEYVDEDDEYGDAAYPPMPPQHDKNLHLQQDIPDTAMLDSVVLPAIASVSRSFRLVLEAVVA